MWFQVACMHGTANLAAYKVEIRTGRNVCAAAINEKLVLFKVAER